MQRLVLLMIVVATTFDFLAKGDGWGRFALLPQPATYLGDVLGVIALLYVIVAGTRNRFQFVRPAYWFAFGILLFTVAAGILVNQVEPGPIFAGLRTYLRTIPWFFVGAVFAFTESDIRKQMHLLLAICLIQVPLAVEQRMHGFGGDMGFVTYTGDATTGTLIISSVLSLFLICGMCMLVAFYVRQRLATWKFMLLFPALLTPTLINETKGTLVFLPIGLIATYLAAADPRRRLRALLTALSLTLLVGVVFVPVYDYFRSEREAAIMEFLTDPDRTAEYLQRDIEIGSQSPRPAGRLDSVVVPLRALAADPAKLAFGYGIGNASDSRLGTQFIGEQHPRFTLFMVHAFARITLELGVVGLTLVFVLMWLVYVDSRNVARRANDQFGAVAAGMSGAVVVVAVSVIYKDLVSQISMSFLFWYFAGLVASQRMRIAAEAHRQVTTRNAIVASA